MALDTRHPCPRHSDFAPGCYAPGPLALFDPGEYYVRTPHSIMITHQEQDGWPDNPTTLGESHLVVTVNFLTNSFVPVQRPVKTAPYEG